MAPPTRVLEDTSALEGLSGRHNYAVFYTNEEVYLLGKYVKMQGRVWLWNE